MCLQALRVRAMVQVSPFTFSLRVYICFYCIFKQSLITILNCKCNKKSIQIEDTVDLRYYNKNNAPY